MSNSTVRASKLTSLSTSVRVSPAPNPLQTVFVLTATLFIYFGFCYAPFLTVLALLSEGQRSLAGSRNPSDTSGMPPPVAVYDRDPNHLWNRLFGVFYQQKIANNSHDRNMVAWLRNQVGEAHWIGPDVLDPPLGYHPKFLLEDEPFARCNALLDEFISRRGATLIG